MATSKKNNSVINLRTKTKIGGSSGNKNRKTKGEAATIAKGRSRTPEFERILSEGAGKSGKIVTTAGTAAQVRESGAERIARETAGANAADRNERIAEYKRRVKAGEMELAKVPKAMGMRDAVASELNMKPAPKAKTKVARPTGPTETTATIVDNARSAAKKAVGKPSTPAAKKAAVKRAVAKKAAPAAPDSPAKKPTASSAPTTPKKSPARAASGAKGKKFTTKDFNSSDVGKQAIDDYKSGKITRAQLVEKQRAWSGSTKTGTKPVGSAVERYVKGVVQDIGKMDKGALVKEAIIGKPGEAKIGRFKAAGGVGGAVNAALAAASLASAADVPGKIKKFMDKYTEPKRLPAHAPKMNVTKTSVTKATTPKPVISRPAAAKTAKTATSAKTSVASASGVHTVSKGDTLWDIAQANKTSVDALLKANPELAKRKAAGKTVLFSNTKVRIPKK